MLKPRKPFIYLFLLYGKGFFFQYGIETCSMDGHLSSYSSRRKYHAMDVIDYISFLLMVGLIGVLLLKKQTDNVGI